jgi:predicted amidohydrolase YtcJ
VPAALERVDGHALWVNSAPLAAAGITRATPEPKGGSILRTPQGEPSGIPLDGAADLITRSLPAATGAQVEQCLLDGLGDLARLGFASVADMGVDRPTLEAYRRLERQGRLPIRVFAYLAHDPALMLQELKRPRTRGTSFFQVQGVKFYLEGALGSRGARLLAPTPTPPGRACG